ncbi:hypothetical protein L917_06287 [Phytophthora nicotianae]|uniref:Ubiquitin-like protease family profile domain-containing protein n=3 Tax=Phytophthora nicotianae TaxID=4792 RepID=W2LHE0_PHYNI|nr:hypothetical protein L917_06287 [Phytophthora nicotianae]
MDAIAQIDKAIVWTKTICFDTKIDPWYLVEEDERLLDGLKDTRLQSTGFEILDIVGRGHFSDASLSRVLEKLYSSNSSVVVVTPDLFGWVVGRKITMDTESVEAILSTISGECAIIPISCNSNHWCAIMIDIAKRIVYIYDAMRSSYQYSVRVDMGVQLDNYNCGLFILLAFEHFTGAPSLGRMDKKLMMYLRYRYLCMCLH